MKNEKVLIKNYELVYIDTFNLKLTLANTYFLII